MHGRYFGSSGTARLSRGQKGFILTSRQQSKYLRLKMESSFWGGFRCIVFFIAFAFLLRWYGRGCLLGPKDKGTAYACYFKVVAEVSLNS
jgi:hypothetical protein